MPLCVSMDTECGAWVVAFLSLSERRRLRAVCRRWHFTCPWLQQPADQSGGREAALQPRKSPLNLSGRAFQHSWDSFFRREAALVLPLVLTSLPDPDKEETLELKRGLCLSTNTGVRPSFENDRARSGYIAAKMNRSGNLPNLLFTAELAELRSELFRCGERTWNVALYGGGPGFEVLGLAMLRKYLRADEDVAFQTTVFDNELGWQAAVDGVQRTIHQLECPGITCGFRTCDITLNVLDAVNSAVLEQLPNTQLFVFAFVCVENFCLLEDSQYCFLRSLFAAARVGSYFVFTDSTHRLWPAIYELADAAAPNRFRVWTPFARRCHYALVLKKVAIGEDPTKHAFHTQAMDRLALFRRHHQLQLERSSKSGHPIELLPQAETKVASQ